MSIIHRYLLQQIFKHFGMVLITVVGIYVAVDFFEKIDDFMEAGLPADTVLSYFGNKIPFIVAQITPVGLLLAILITFGLMTRHNEVVALKSGGMGIYHLLKPVLGLGVGMALLLFCLSEVVVPITMNKANAIWLRQVRKEQVVSSRQKNIWLKGNHLITHVKHYDRGTSTVFGVSRYRFDDSFQLIQRLDAREGVFQNGIWVLKDILEQQRQTADSAYEIRHWDRKAVTLDFSPADLTRVVKSSEEMSFNELSAYIDRIEAEGYDATSQRVDLHSKIAFPCVCIILGMAGMGIAVRGWIKEGLPVGIAYGMGIAFCYWIFYSFCVSLGYGHMLPPFMAAWAANLVFFCGGIIMLLNAE